VENIGIDVHKKHSQICVQNADGKVVLEARIGTRRRQLSDFFGSRPKAKILMEASTVSEWVAQGLEELGHEVLVVDPNFALTYATRNPKVKTDVRDARALADACRHGHYRLAHRASAQAREKRAWLGTRSGLVRCRTKLVNQVRAQLDLNGLVLERKGGPENLPAKVRALRLPPMLQPTLEPMLVCIEALSAQIVECDTKLDELAEQSPVAKRLMSAPQIGAVTALCFEAVVDESNRFMSAAALSSYLGLTPSAHDSATSGKKKKLGMPITKRGNTMLRWLLVEAGNRLLNQRCAGAEELQAWGKGIESRRGRGVASVALARKLAGILFALWRDGANFNSKKLRKAA
jgi:transposase